MKLQNFTLNDGGKLSVIPHEKGTYLLLDGQPLAGPFDPKLARFRVTVNLPPGRGKVGVHLTRDGRYEAIHDGSEIHRRGAIGPSSPLLGRPRQVLLALGVVNYVLFFVVDRWALNTVEAWPFLLAAGVLLSVTLWAYVRPASAQRRQPVLGN